jgi:hypothetical protein
MPEYEMAVHGPVLAQGYEVLLTKFLGPVDMHRHYMVHGKVVFASADRALGIPLDMLDPYLAPAAVSDGEYRHRLVKRKGSHSLRK